MFNLHARETDKNSGMFYPRSAGILRQLTSDLYSTALQPDFTQDILRPYAGGDLAAVNHVTSGMRRLVREKDDVNAANTNGNPQLPLIYQADGTIDPASSFLDVSEAGGVFTLDTRSVGAGFSTTFPNNAVNTALALNHRARVNNLFFSIPMTPLMYQLGADGTGEFDGIDLFLSKLVNGVRLYVPNVICNGRSVSGNTYNIDLDLSDVLSTGRSYRVTGNAGTLENSTGAALDATFFIRGWSLWTHYQDGLNSNFPVGVAPDARQVMRNQFRDQLKSATSSRYLIRGGTSTITTEGPKRGLF